MPEAVVEGCEEDWAYEAGDMSLAKESILFSQAEKSVLGRRKHFRRMP